MKIAVQPIESDKDLQEALDRLNQLFGRSKTPSEAAEMEILMTLTEAFEDKHYPIDPILPHELIAGRLEDLGSGRAPLVEVVRSSTIAAQILKGKKRLTLELVRKIAGAISVPAASLLLPSDEECFRDMRTFIDAFVVDGERGKAHELLPEYAKELPKQVIYIKGSSALRLLAGNHHQDAVVSCGSSSAARSVFAAFRQLAFALGCDDPGVFVA